MYRNFNKTVPLLFAVFFSLSGRFDLSQWLVRPSAALAGFSSKGATLAAGEVKCLQDEGKELLVLNS